MIDALRFRLFDLVVFDRRLVALKHDRQKPHLRLMRPLQVGAIIPDGMTG